MSMYSRAFLLLMNNKGKNKLDTFYHVVCKIIRINKIKKHSKEAYSYDIDRQYVYDMGDYIDNETAVNYMIKSKKKFIKVYGIVEHISLNDVMNTVTVLLKANNGEKIAASLQKCEFEKLVEIDKGSIIKVCGTPTFICKYNGVPTLELSKSIIYGHGMEQKDNRRKRTKWVTL